jgi:ribosomal protein S21
MSTNVNMRPKRNESSEKLVRRFIKKVKKERIIEEARDKMRFVSASVKKRLKKERAEKTRQREERKKEKLIQKYTREQ